VPRKRKNETKIKGEEKEPFLSALSIEASSAGSYENES
jgi:hypothetical protein